MFLEHREKEENKRQATAGYDLTDAYAQISYCLPGEPCPKTISLQADQEQYLIPALLGRYTDQDLWVYGPKAQAAAAAGEVFLVDGLLTKAAHQEMVEVGGQNYSSVALLSLFLKRTMSLLAPIVRPERLQALVFSVPEVSVPILSAVTDAVGMLGLKNASLFLIGRAESFFYYNICQPEELWKQDVLLCDFSGTFLHTLLFTANRKTSPVACFVEEADWKEVAAGREDLDQCFLETMKALIGDRNVSCVYLIGEGFLGEWYQESLRFLCQERRVFLGNNLYSKGACYAARQRMTPGSVSEGYVFLGKDMLKANISLYAEKRGQDSCQPLLDAGTNWYDAKAEIDFLLEEENRFSLRITPLNGGEIRDVEIALTGAHNAHPSADRHGGSDDAAPEHGRFRLRRVLPGDAPVLGEDDFDRGEGKGDGSDDEHHCIRSYAAFCVRIIDENSEENHGTCISVSGAERRIALLF